MATKSVTDVKVKVIADGKTYYTNSNLYELVSEENLYDFAEAVNSLQNAVMEKVVKTTDYRLLP